MAGAEPAIIELPERLDRPALAELRARLEGTGEAQPVVLRGASDQSFCDGLALGSLQTASAEERAAGLQDFRAIVLELALGPRATIAAVRGRALGGGLGLAAACDDLRSTGKSIYASVK